MEMIRTVYKKKTTVGSREIIDRLQNIKRSLE